jgi:hypothetical protein
VMKRLAVVLATILSVSVPVDGALGATAEAHASLAVESSVLADCFGSMDKPHPSAGANGVIAKAHFLCATGTSNLIYQINLFLCPFRTEGTPNKAWMHDNCTEMGVNANAMSPPPAGREFLRYVPPSGQPGARGTGWWIAHNHYNADGNDHIVISQWAEIAAP